MMKSKKYEQLTSQIAKSFYRKVEGIKPQQVSHGQRSKWTGKSRYKHQIDVIVRGPSDAILVECKYWEKPVPPEAVLTFSARVSDIRPTFAGTIHPVVVTKSRFTRGAKLLAKYYEIDIAVIRNPAAFAFSYKKLRGISLATQPMAIKGQKVYVR